MAVIVIYDPADPKVTNRVTQFLPSAHPPDHAAETNKVQDPDLSLLWTSPQGPYIVPLKYWKWGGGNLIVEMNTTEKDAVDAIDPEVQVFNQGVTGTGAKLAVDAAIEVERGAAANASLRWDETLETWIIGLYGQEIEVADIDQVPTNLPDLGDVRSPMSPSAGQVLTWNQGNGEWENADADHQITVKDENSSLGLFNSLNFLGASVTVTDGGGGEADITISGGATTLASLTDTTITTPQNDDVLIYSGGTWINEALQQGGAEATLTVWTLVSGDLYRADFNHGLGTQCIAVFMTDTVTDKEIRPEDTEVLDDNNLRIFVRGNTHSIKVCAITGRGPRGPEGAQGPAGGGLANIVEDTTPQLGGNLDMNGFSIGGVTPTEMSYVDATSSIQTQLNGKAASSHTHVEADITDLGNYALVTHTHTYRFGHTWAIAGKLSVASPPENVVLPFFVSMASGQTAQVVKARFVIESGTNCNVKIQKNGVDLTGYTSITVTTTEASVTPAAQSLAEDDKLQLVINSVTGSPANLSFTLFIEYTQ